MSILMQDLATKPDMVAIRHEGQAFLAEIESRGHILPSLEDVIETTSYSIAAESRSRQMAGFAEDRNPKVIKPK